jgi:hypothetical protein
MLKMYGAPIDPGQLDLAALAQSLLDFEAWKNSTEPLRIKAWAQIDGSGSIRASKNIVAVVRNSTGNYTITIPAGMVSAKESLVATVNVYAPAGTYYMSNVQNQSATTVQVFLSNAAGSAAADAAFNIIIAGD